MGTLYQLTRLPESVRVLSRRFGLRNSRRPTGGDLDEITFSADDCFRVVAQREVEANTHCVHAS
jgi:hypothetical protein